MAEVAPKSSAAYIVFFTKPANKCALELGFVRQCAVLFTLSRGIGCVKSSYSLFVFSHTYTDTHRKQFHLRKQMAEKEQKLKHTHICSS